MRVTDLRALRDKYERMLSLRRLHARAKAEADFDEPDPRPEMLELARRFPGSLREIDELPLEVIERSIAELRAAEDDGARVVPWMRAQSRFHELARGVLSLKRWLRGRTLTARVAEECADAMATLPEPARGEARAWLNQLGEVARPPRGRLMDLVHARLASELAMEPDEARACVVRVARARRLRGGA